MYEGLAPHDDFGDDSEFDRVVEQAVPSAGIPFSHNGMDLMLTPANAAVRLLSEDGQDYYSRVVVYPGDGSVAAFRPEFELMQTMVRGGFPVETPAQPDETDEEFMDANMHIWMDG